jgi:hypothetical protein
VVSEIVPVDFEGVEDAGVVTGLNPRLALALDSNGVVSNLAHSPATGRSLSLVITGIKYSGFY